MLAGVKHGWAWGQSYSYGTANGGLIMKGRLLVEHPSGSEFWSGGLTDPEASAFLLPLFALTSLCMWLWWGKVRFCGTEGVNDTSQGLS